MLKIIPLDPVKVKRALQLIGLDTEAIQFCKDSKDLKSVTLNGIGYLINLPARFTRFIRGLMAKTIRQLREQKPALPHWVSLRPYRLIVIK